MPTQEPSRLWFELNTGSDPIAGQMHADGNPSRSFHSWLELVALIEETRAKRPEPKPHGDPGRPPDNAARDRRRLPQDRRPDA